MKLKFNSAQKSVKAIKKTFLVAGKLRKPLQINLQVQDKNTNYFFTPKCKTELFRYLTFFTKEEGTLQWLSETITDGDVFVDIGANIGIYSLYAAKLGKKIKVFSFEPHKPNFITLIQNVVDNQLQDVVSPIAIALGDSNDIIKLNYPSLVSGSSGSQLGHKKAPGEDREFKPEFEEIVPAMTLSELVERGVLPTPTVIKIDVDGNEIKIINGMAKILTSANKPKSIQVELNVGEQADIAAALEKFGYKLQNRHFTLNGKAALERGEKLENIAHNAVFVA